MDKIGILAYGSLIDSPGKEIKPLIVKKVNCLTPFKVEYLRKSKTRGYAPTLVPSNEQGESVKATILVLNNEVLIDYAKNILWRRETGKVGSLEKYSQTKNPNKNKVQVKEIKNFKNIETVLYTSIGKNIEGIVNADILSDLAIKSILTYAGENNTDGINYLLANNKNGIKTKLSEEYKSLILKKTECNTLEEVIIKMSKKRTEL